MIENRGDIGASKKVIAFCAIGLLLFLVDTAFHVTIFGLHLGMIKVALLFSPYI